MQISDQKTIADYILSVKGKGTFLAYSDYQIIEDWLKLSKDTTELLLILDDIVPNSYNNLPSGSKGPSLKALSKKVVKTLQERAKTGSSY